MKILANAGASLSSPTLLHNLIKKTKDEDCKPLLTLLRQYNYPFDNVDSKGKIKRAFTLFVRTNSSLFSSFKIQFKHYGGHS